LTFIKEEEIIAKARQQTGEKMRNLFQNYRTAKANQVGGDLYQGSIITPTKLMQFATTQGDYAQVLQEFGANINSLQEKLTNHIRNLENNNLGAQPQNRGATRLVGGRDRVQVQQNQEITSSPSLQAIMTKAEEIANQNQGAQGTTQEQVGEDNITFKHFLLALYEVTAQDPDHSFVAAYLQESGFDWARFLNPENVQGQKSAIEELCINLNTMAKEGKIDPIIGRDEEILRVVEILGKKKKNNPVLLGDAGVGKTAIPEGLALLISQGNVPDTIKNAVIYSLEIGSMVAGTQFRGQFEEKVQMLLKEFEALEAKGELPVLFIDEIHTVMGAGSGGGGSLGLSDMLKPHLAKGKLRCIGATTTAEWNKFIAQDRAMKRRFSQVDVVEPTREQCIEILRGAKRYYEQKHNLTYSDESLVKAVDLSIEFITDSKLPDKALDLMDYAGSSYRIQVKQTVDEEGMCLALTKTKKIPLEKIHQKEQEKKEYVPMGAEIKKELFGQDHAVETVVEVVERSVAGLQEDDKTIGSFLFIGPTGVGKTELAKQVAKQMKCHMERIDMSEYQEPHSVAKLIGAPPGYVGFEQGGRLTKALEKNPHCVILIDEIEKAHPKVQEIFLQIMDNAKVTDSQGNELNCKNVLLLFTSNAGAREMQRQSLSLVADGGKTQASKSKEIVNNSFLPEFIGRVNGVVNFNALPKEMMVNVVDKFVTRLNTQRLASKNVTVELSQDAKLWLVDKDFDPRLGARPIENKVRTFVVNELTKSFLYGELKNGKTKVNVSVENGNLKFSYS
jgi:ATP-dependent Clp protease ATP-binding subunit ClpA